MTAVELRRIDDSRNMRRFYRLDIETDLFGGFLLVRQWGRIGSRGGRSVAECYDDESLALAALQKQAERKRRRGYVGEEPVDLTRTDNSRPEHCRGTGEGQRKIYADFAVVGP